MPIAPELVSHNVSQAITLGTADAQENNILPLLLNYRLEIPSTPFFSLYFPILPSVRRSIKLIEESSRPMASEFILKC
jgi:hypothetical protein